MHLWQDAGYLGGAGAELNPERLRITLYDVTAQRLDKGQVRTRAGARFVALSAKCGPILTEGVLGQLVSQAGLANARLAEHGHQ